MMYYKIIWVFTNAIRSHDLNKIKVENSSKVFNIILLAQKPSKGRFSEKFLSENLIITLGSLIKLFTFVDRV